MIRQGKFKCYHPEKYKGNPTQIFYRSGWERYFMSYLDNHSEVLEWSSEELRIPYRSAVDGLRHSYFPDFFVKFRDKTGKVKCMVVEIKPREQTIPPTGNLLTEKNKKLKQSKKYIKEVVTYATNVSKWTAAEAYCKDRNWEFRLLTENELYGAGFNGR